MIDPDNIPEYCDLMIASEWHGYVKAGAFIPSDGTGYWATSDWMDRATNVFTTPQPEWATHAAWFNK